MPCFEKPVELDEVGAGVVASAGQGERDRGMWGGLGRQHGGHLVYLGTPGRAATAAETGEPLERAHGLEVPSEEGRCASGSVGTLGARRVGAASP